MYDMRESGKGEYVGAKRKSKKMMIQQVKKGKGHTFIHRSLGEIHIPHFLSSSSLLESLLELLLLYKNGELMWVNFQPGCIVLDRGIV